ncbi:zinc finger, CCHC-type containing protein [Tanacetum coccineum]
MIVRVHHIVLGMLDASCKTYSPSSFERESPSSQTQLLQLDQRVLQSALEVAAQSRSKLEYKFQDKENSEDIFSFGSALEDFISVVFVHDRNIVLENQLLSVSLLICLGKRDYVERIPPASNWLERLLAESISTWEDLTTRFLAQFFPPGRTAKLRNDILMFQQHHGESLSEAWTRFKDLLQKVPYHGLDLWLQFQIFYDHVNCTTRESIDYAAGGRLRKLRLDKDCDTIEKLAQYENEGWNDAFNSEEVSFNYENPDIKQLLGIMEHKVDTLMKNAISLMGKSESVFRLTTNERYRPPTKPSRQEEFEHIVMNFIYDQEERIKQLKNYMQNITNEFMEFSSEVALRLKERIKESEKENVSYSCESSMYKIRPANTIAMSKRARSTGGHASSAHNERMEEKVRKFRLFDNEDHQMNYNTLVGRSIHSEDVVDWEFLSKKGLAQSFFDSINTDPFSGQ